MKQVIVFPRGQLSDEDRKAMKAAGVIAVEADDPSKVVVTVPQPHMASADDMLLAALHGITSLSTERASYLFTNELNRRLKERDKQRGGK